MKTSALIEDVLFKNAPPEAKALNKKARKELRLKARAAWKKANVNNAV